MAVVAITNTPRDMVGDFDMQVRGVAADSTKKVVLQKSLGSATTNWTTLRVISGQEHDFVKNTGTNSFRLAEDVSGVTVEANQ